MKNPQLSPQCCQCSLPAWRGMFCPVCGSSASAYIMVETLSANHGKSLQEIGEVLENTSVRTMFYKGGPITRPLARVLLSCLPYGPEIWERADTARRKLANRVIARHQRNMAESAGNNETQTDCPL